MLARALGGTTVATTVSDPLGREVPAAVLVVERDGRRTAYVEAAQASGLHLLGADERDPGLTSTWGVGQLLEAAVEQGATKVVVGVGGSATNDAGRRHARRARGRAGLGAGPRGPGPGLGAPTTRCPASPACSHRLAGVEIVLATDDDTPLLGLQGTSAVEAPRKGASPEQAQALEGALGPLHRRRRPGAAVARPSTCSAGCRAGSTARPGAGAAGGLGYAPARPRRPAGRRRRRGAARVRVRRRRGPQRPRRHRRRPGRLETLRGLGRRRRGGRHARDRAAHRARRRGVPRRSARDDDASGLAGTYAVADSRAEVEAMVADPVQTLAARTARVARTWSPPR